MKSLSRSLAAAALAAGAVLVSGAANAAVVVDITQSGGNLDVTASGSLDLTGATFDHQQPYSTGIIPGGSNWYVALGSSPGMDWYRLTSTTLPYGTDGNYYTSSDTSGDAFSIWGFAGGAPLVGVTTGYVSGTSISSSMVLHGLSLADTSLMPGTYVFTVPSDTITLNISAVPEPASWALLLGGGIVAGIAGRKRARS